MIKNKEQIPNNKVSGSLCNNCYQKNSLILHGSHDVEHEYDGCMYILNIYTCSICRSVHEVYTPISTH